MSKRRLTVLSGAGISAESGLNTFRDNDGLWEQHRVEDVATPEAWNRDVELVLRFYNQRRRQLGQALPNDAHLILAGLESHYNVKIITQNVDDLHERAGSSDVLHLHGELTKVRCSAEASYVQDIGYADLNLGQMSPSGHQLRPHIVWFGEAVPLITEAERIVAQSDILIVVGTSLQVYPAAGLLHLAPSSSSIILIDPDPDMRALDGERVKVFNEKATIGMQMVARYLESV